ncbi:MAG: hypothetical protein EPO43_13515 [Rugosibacter sp.]|nr:MAG: hypothetical protein EPO43_13515 [Rugosibacter sp.]
MTTTDTYVSADGGDTAFGKRWASQLTEINPRQLAALQNGKYLAVDVQGEYIVYLKVAEEGGHV